MGRVNAVPVAAVEGREEDTAMLVVPMTGFTTAVLKAPIADLTIS